MYDPLEIVSPVLVCVKVLFQELCSNKVEWDEELNNEGKNAGLAGLTTSKASEKFPWQNVFTGFPKTRFKQ